MPPADSERNCFTARARRYASVGGISACPRIKVLGRGPSVIARLIDELEVLDKQKA
jgi:hypothetical protein